jgi:hypothetical protein
LISYILTSVLSTYPYNSIYRITIDCTDRSTALVLDIYKPLEEVRLIYILARSPLFKEDKEGLLDAAAVIRGYKRLAISTICEQVSMPNNAA